MRPLPIGIVVNLKLNLDKTKQKIKRYAPEIVAVLSITVAVGAYVYFLSQKNSEDGITGFRLPEVAKEIRDAIMADPRFKLLELSEDEFLLVRDYPTE